jgi:hypothetical protein
MGENRPICSRVSHNAQPRLVRQGGGNGQFIEGVRDGSHQTAPDSGLLPPRLRLGVGGDPMERLFALGVPLAALIVVTTESLSGFKGADRMPARPRYRAMAEWEELQ